MRKKTFMKFASLCATGGFMLQFSGCFGDFWQVLFRNIPIGAGRMVGELPGTIVTGIIQPTIDALLGGLGG